METAIPDTGPAIPEEPVTYEPESATYDLCVAWTTGDDAGFVEMLDAACRAQNLTLLQVTPANVERMCEDLVSGKMRFRALFDRASDESRDFLPVVEWARAHGVYRINPLELAKRSWDKAAIHDDLADVVPVPYTVFLPPFRELPQTPELDLARLGPTFTIKPAHGGGGAGVVVVATSDEQVPEARRAFPEDTFMLQARVVPAKLDGRVAWFRIISAAGKFYPTWWDFDNRDYRCMTVAEESHYRLGALRTLTENISQVCGLQLFSTEIAVDSEGQFVVVDYVNDPIDLTLKSKKPDGVPDELARYIAEDLVELLTANI